MREYTVRCKKDYVEDGDCYWSEGKEYKCTETDNGTYEIETNFGGTGAVGNDYLVDDFDEYFEKSADRDFTEATEAYQSALDIDKEIAELSRKSREAKWRAITLAMVECGFCDDETKTLTPVICVQTGKRGLLQATSDSQGRPCVMFYEFLKDGTRTRQMHDWQSTVWDNSIYSFEQNCRRLAAHYRVVGD